MVDMFYLLILFMSLFVKLHRLFLNLIISLIVSLKPMVLILNKNSRKYTAYFVESPGSLLYEMLDLPEICRIAPERDIPVGVDNTWGSAYGFITRWN